MGKAVQGSNSLAFKAANNVGKEFRRILCYIRHPLRYVRYLRGRRTERQTVKILGFPVLMTLDPRQQVNRCIMRLGIFEGFSAQTVASLLQPSDVFLDIGANYGQYMVIAAHKTGQTGKVIAFEPQKRIIPYLQSSVEQNCFTNVTIINCALGEKESVLKLYQPDSENNGRATLRYDENLSVVCEEVTVRPLTAVLNEEQISHVDGIKMDVEGAELSVLKGALPLFQKQPPKFIHIEVINEHLKRFGTEVKDIFDFFKPFGYVLFGELNNQWVPVADVEEWQEKTGASADVLAVLRDSELLEKVTAMPR